MTIIKQEINIKAIILAAGRDFGRCRLASKVPAPLWPVEDKPVISHLLNNLSQQGIKHAVVCSNGDSRCFNDLFADFNSMKLHFLDEPLPAGTAGCIRDASDRDKNEIFLIFNACTLIPPDIDILLQIHQIGKSDLTIIFDSSSKTTNSGPYDSQIFICNSSVLDYIPQQGYFDIKEGLVPALNRAGRQVYTAVLPEPFSCFYDRASYLDAVNLYLKHRAKSSQNIAKSARIGQKVATYGSVIIMDNARIANDTIIFGPAIIGKNVVIGTNALVVNSVLWDGAHLGNNCQIRNCMLDRNMIVANGLEITDAALTPRPCGKLKSMINKFVFLAAGKCEPFKNNLSELLTHKFPYLTKIENLYSIIFKFCAIVVLFAIFLWSYWPEIGDLWSIWQSSDEYSSGILVPFLMIYILWVKRKQIINCPVKHSLWGLFTFIGAQFLRYFGLFFMYASAQRLSLILSIASLILFLFGWKLLAKMATILLFLCLALPLPRSVHTAIMLPLQNLATASAVFALETLGYAITRQGNVIYINDTAIAIAEACNGLRMVMAFFVIIGLIAFLVNRSWWEKLVLLISVLPIAIICNTIRLTVTTIFFSMFYNSKYDEFFHDFSGYAMMPMALAIIAIELRVLTKLTKSPEGFKSDVIVPQSRLA